MKNKRRRLTGRVVRAKMQNTVTVRVDRTYRHPLYQKVLRAKKRFLVYDELGAQPGDQVRIVESKPISKRKRWVVEAVIKKTETAE